MVLKILMLLSVTAFTSKATALSKYNCENHILAAADIYNIPAGILYAVGLTETGRKGTLHPFALNIEGKAVYATSPQHAFELFAKARLENKKLIDLGCMQINHYYHHDQFATVQDMLDPAQNVQYAAKFLSRLKTRHKTWTMAVARYHAGPDNDPAQKKYVCRVIKNVVATGFGEWTNAAKDFCQPD